MASFTTIGQSIGTNLLGTGQALAKSLNGDPDLVHFLDPATNSCILQFDCVLSENHQRESPATNFPLEDGSNISDHVFVAPFELTFQGIVTDNPLGTKKQLIQEAFATGITTLLPPLGLATAGAAYGLWLSDQKAKSPSNVAFQKILQLQAGDPTSSPPLPPKPMRVKTATKLYENMIIRSVSVPRDATMTGAIAFQIAMTQLLVVRPQSVNITLVQDKALASKKANEGEQEAEEDNGFSAGYQREKKILGQLKKVAGLSVGS